MLKQIKLAIRHLLLQEKKFYKGLSKLKSKMMLFLNDEQFTKFNIKVNIGIKLNLQSPNSYIE